MPLEEQDRRLWNAERIAEGCSLVEHALRTRRFGPYALQAAVAAVHAEASRAQDTDWAQPGFATFFERCRYQHPPFVYSLYVP